MPYTAQLAEKTQRLTALLAPFAAPAPQVYPSPEQGYRMRAEFRIWHDGDQISYAMFAHGQKASSASLIKLTHFQAAHSSINALMPRLLHRISGCLALHTRLTNANFSPRLAAKCW